MPYAVEGFFLNGGQRCYICRITGTDYVGALAKLEAVEDVSIVYCPNAQAVPGLADLLIEHCERLYRFAGTGPVCLVPPGGHVAGIYARTDIEVGVHRAPANQLVKGAVELELTMKSYQQESLSPQGINLICNLEGKGILV